MINTKTISGFDEKLPEGYLVEEKFKQIISKNYSLSGFTPLDTPNVERVEVLCSKGADDNEIYGIKRLKAEGKEAENFEMGLRFDLTVPLARYIGEYEGELTFPFKRQQIGRVYRGERPQKGRYREFYQADVDIIGNGKLALFADVEIISTIYSSLNELDFGDFVININNKKFLSGFLSSIGIEEEKIVGTISIIDKKDKVDLEKFKQMFLDFGLNEDQILEIINFIKFGEEKSSKEILEFFSGNENELLNEGIYELGYLYNNLLKLGVGEESLKINPAISRGLNYYTGMVFETFISGAESMGSVSSGGRYENLASNFSKNSFPGVGGSIGLSRLIAVLNQLGKISESRRTNSQIMLVNLGEKFLTKNLEIVKSLRKTGVSVELFLDDTVKMQKQLKYANNKKIPYVIIIGDDELEKETVQLKNLYLGTQEEIKIKDIFKKTF